MLRIAKKSALVSACLVLAIVRLKYPDAKVDAVTVWLVVIGAVVLLLPSDITAVQRAIRRVKVGDTEIELAPLSVEATRMKIAAEVADGEESATEASERSTAPPNAPDLTPPPVRARPSVVTEDEPKIDHRATYMLAEELVLRKLEAEWGVPIQRNVKLTSHASRIGVADGVATVGDELRVVEVKFVRARAAIHARLNDLGYRAERLMSVLRERGRVRFTAVVVVSSTEDLELVRTSASRLFQDFAWLDVRVYAFSELSQEFGVTARVP
jgi:hypothetical protein